MVWASCPGLGPERKGREETGTMWMGLEYVKRKKTEITIYRMKKNARKDHQPPTTSYPITSKYSKNHIPR